MSPRFEDSLIEIKTLHVDQDKKSRNSLDTMCLIN